MYYSAKVGIKSCRIYIPALVSLLFVEKVRRSLLIHYSCIFKLSCGLWYVYLNYPVVCGMPDIDCSLAQFSIYVLLWVYVEWLICKMHFWHIGTYIQVCLTVKELNYVVICRDSFFKVERCTNRYRVRFWIDYYYKVFSQVHFLEAIVFLVDPYY